MSIVVNIRYGSNIKSFISNPEKPFIPTAKKEANDDKLDWFTKIGIALMTSFTYGNLVTKVALGAELTATPDQLRQNFSKIIDVFTAIAEPILWGFAVVGLVLVATGNKQMGWARVKSVAYAYIGINCLPAFFAFLRYIAKMLTSAFS